MPSLILDQGLPRSAARIFREMGWDAVHTGDIGMANASVLALCSTHGKFMARTFFGRKKFNNIKKLSN